MDCTVGTLKSIFNSCLAPLDILLFSYNRNTLQTEQTAHTRPACPRARAMMPQHAVATSTSLSAAKLIHNLFKLSSMASLS